MSDGCFIDGSESGSPALPCMILEVAVSLNSNDVEIFSKAKGDWKATEILSEVRAVRSYHLPPRLTVG